jgi:hypothetical protein
MDADAVNVEGYGHNIGWDDCSMDILPEMNRLYWQHFQPSEAMLRSVLQQSRSHLRALVGRESFAGFLNVSLMSDILVKRTDGKGRSWSSAWRANNQANINTNRRTDGARID